MALDVSVSLVTGRMVSSAMRFAHELGLTAPVVGLPGRPDPRDAGAGFETAGPAAPAPPLPADVARDIVVWPAANGLDPHVNHLERFILRTNDPNAGDYSAFMGAQAEFIDDLRSIGHPVTKVLAVGEPPWPVEVAARARAQFAGRADVTISHPRFLEFVAPGVSKGRAIRYLARRLGVPLGSVLAIGDQWNDLEMLAEVGHGAAMPSAPRRRQGGRPVHRAARGGRGCGDDDRGARAGKPAQRPCGLGAAGARGRRGPGCADRADVARLVTGVVTRSR